MFHTLKIEGINDSSIFKEIEKGLYAPRTALPQQLHNYKEVYYHNNINIKWFITTIPNP